MDHMGQLHNNYMLLTGWGVRIAMDLSFSDGQFDGPTFSDRQHVSTFNDQQFNAIKNF